MFKRKKQIKKLQGGLPVFPEEYGYEAFHVMAVYILGGLKAYKSCGNSYPGTLKSYNEWMQLLDKMIWSFDQIVNECPDDPETIHFNKKWKEAEEKGIKLMKTNGNQIVFSEILDEGRPTKEEVLAYHARIQEGLDLFAKYFRDLWD